MAPAGSTPAAGGGRAGSPASLEARPWVAYCTSIKVQVSGLFDGVEGLRFRAQRLGLRGA